MVLDTGRQRDLAHIERTLKDPKKATRLKRAAQRARSRILEQSRDRTLVAMRERLARATYANDKREIWKVTNQIKDYQGEGRFEAFEQGLDR